MLLKNLTIFDAVHEAPISGDIRVENGKLAAVGGHLRAKKGEETLDLTGLQAYPGFVDAHSHISIEGWGGVTGGQMDVNEKSDVVSPQVRGIDAFNPFDAAIPLARKAGVTTVCTGPGSAEVLGGTFVALKLYGTCVDDMAIKPEAAMKCAFGENVKKCFPAKTATRMGIAAKLRETLFLAKDYMEKKESAEPGKGPKFDMKLEAMIPVLKREMPLKAHAHRADDILTAIRIAKEFNLKLTLEHVTEGHLIVNELVRAGYPVAVGPLMSSATKQELANRTLATPKILSDAGLSVSLITDSPVNMEQYLPMIAGIAVQEGMDPFKALQAITINPAKHIGVEDRVGSLEVGKDADIVITTANPLTHERVIKKVIIDGQIVEEL